jgi:putative Ca2+/H+ antiporter (TMEM165/GDT1 family)
MEILLSSFIFMFVAEMGDKSQIFAIAFAARFKALLVVLAILTTTVLTNLLAVVAGRIAAEFLSTTTIQIFASLFFITFGVWTLYNNNSDDNSDNKNKPPMRQFFTMTTAFFIVETGDKSQLAAMVLSMKYASPVSVLTGAILGVICADAVAIIFGITIGKTIPKKTMKRLSAIVFLIFGISGILKILH